MSEYSHIKTDPVAALRRLRAGCAAGRPLDPGLAGWLQQSLDRYLGRQSFSLEAAFGIQPRHGGLAWWRREAIRERDQALRALAAEHFAEFAPTRRARAIACAARRYGASGWRFDCRDGALPPEPAGSIRHHLFRAFRSGAPMPLGERQIRNILRDIRTEDQSGESTLAVPSLALARSARRP